jgi:hypothetical protein
VDTFGKRNSGLAAAHSIIAKPNLQVFSNTELSFVNNINAKANLNPSNADLIEHSRKEQTQLKTLFSLGIFVLPEQIVVLFTSGGL